MSPVALPGGSASSTHCLDQTLVHWQAGLSRMGSAFPIMNPLGAGKPKPCPCYPDQIKEIRFTRRIKLKRPPRQRACCHLGKGLGNRDELCGWMMCVGGVFPPFSHAGSMCHLPETQPSWRVWCQHLCASSAGLCVPLAIHLQKAACASGCAQGGLRRGLH